MYVKRYIEEKIEKYINSPEIIAIFRARQVGKTTLLKEIYKKVSNPIFLTFEDIELKILFEEDIKSFIQLYIEPYDNIFISGSSVVELSINAVKYLAGRVMVFHLYSFSFEEFLKYKDKNLFNLIKLPLFAIFKEK